jgi:hypothetical protein
MRTLAIDPGTTHSGWVIVDGPTVLGSGKDANGTLLDDFLFARSLLRGAGPVLRADLVLIEAMSPRGMRLGVETMEALRWSGRFEEAARPHPVVRISRDEVKRVLLGKDANKRGADAALRVLLTDRYAAIAGSPLGGRSAAVGVKAHPGPLFGVKADAWAALALVVAHQDGADDVETERAKRAAAKAARAAA